MSQNFPWHQHSEEQSIIKQATNLLSGLTHPEAAERLIKYGSNLLKDAKDKSVWKIFFSQFTDLLVVVLIGAAIIAAALGEPQDTIAIIAIIILNAVLGFSQEYRAEKAMAALKALTTPHARVRRHGQVITIPAIQLVPGDIVLLEAGNIVPADLRILESFMLNVDESLLTGESLPVGKISSPLRESSLPIAEQKNMAFKGTVVTNGRATGLVVRTGMTTELGRIATLLREEVEVKTPLQNRIARFAKRLTFAVVILCLAIFGIGLFRGEDPVLMFLTALSLAVAAIPEALPAVVTVALALGARAMGKKNALVRKLPAVESLGSVTTICTDKTGTLTENRMQARRFYLSGKLFANLPDYSSADSRWEILIRNLILNNDVTLGPDDALMGDPTETALAQAALYAGADKKDLEKKFPRVAEFPFSSERGMMSTIHRTPSVDFVLSKGAPEKILPLCIDEFGTEKNQKLDLPQITAAIEELATMGMRVLALATRTLPKKATEMDLSAFENNLSFIGLVGLMDPPPPRGQDRH